MGMNVLNIPLHKIGLFSDLFQGEAQMGVWPALPIEGVTMILGNWFCIGVLVLLVAAV